MSSYQLPVTSDKSHGCEPPWFMVAMRAKFGVRAFHEPSRIEQRLVENFGHTGSAAERQCLEPQLESLDLERTQIQLDGVIDDLQTPARILHQIRLMGRENPGVQFDLDAVGRGSD